MTNIMEKYKNQWKRKQTDEEEENEEIFSSSIFDILQNEYQIGELVWTKFNGISSWPSFIYGSFSENWKHIKLVPKSNSSITEKHYFVYGFGSHFQYAWFPQTSLSRYENRKNDSMKISKEQSQLSDELRPLWIEALKEADEIAGLPIQLRTTALEKILRRLILRGKSKSSPSESIIFDDDIPISLRINEDQRNQSINKTSMSCMVNKRAMLSNKRFQVSLESIERSKHAYSIDVTRSENNHNHDENDDVVFVQIHTPISSNSISLTTAICHFLDQGIPSLTVYEELRLVNQLIHHRLGSLLTLIDAQLYFEQYVMNIAMKNYQHRMLFVQSDYFYDFLLKYPQIILRHRHWFKDFKQTLMPIHSEKILLKKWQLATLLHAHINLEECFH